MPAVPGARYEPQTCVRCEGKGTRTGKGNCKGCGGAGSVLVAQPAQSCGRCEGKGEVKAGLLGWSVERCSVCGGCGWANSAAKADHDRMPDPESSSPPVPSFAPPATLGEEKCAFCLGIGYDPTRPGTGAGCPVCLGARTIPVRQPPMKCPQCVGMGRERGYGAGASMRERPACTNCGGTGWANTTSRYEPPYVPRPPRPAPPAPPTTPSSRPDWGTPKRMPLSDRDIPRAKPLSAKPKRGGDRETPKRKPLSDKGAPRGKSGLDDWGFRKKR